MKSITAASITLLLSAGLALAQSATPGQPETPQPAAPQAGASQPGASQSGAAQPAPAAAAQPSQPHFPAGALLPVELTKSLDAKKAKPGDPVSAQIFVDLKNPSGKVVIPQGSKVSGHVAEARAKQKDASGSALGIAFDKVEVKNGPEVSLSAAIQALQVPQNNLNNEGGYAPAPGAGNTSGGASNPSQGQSSGNGSMPTNTTQSTPTPSTPVPTANNAGDQRLTASTQGVLGMPGATLSAGNAQDTVISSEKNDVKLESGTRMILRTN
jgi:hypothetical protein